MGQKGSGILVKILLGELSKYFIILILTLFNIPSIIIFLRGNIIVIAANIYLKPINTWLISEWLLMISVALTYTFSILYISIKFHKYFVRKKKYLFFKNDGYLWKMLVQERKIESEIPLCPIHNVKLSERYKGEFYKCQFCDKQILFLDRWKYYDNAKAKGIAILDGVYNDYAKNSIMNKFKTKLFH